MKKKSIERDNSLFINILIYDPGQHSTFILGIGPDNRSLLPERDVVCMKKFGSELNILLIKTLDQVLGTSNIYYHSYPIQ